MIVLDIAAAFFIAALAGMGIGSGGLFAIYLTLVSGMPQLAAQGFNLLFFLFSSGASLIYNSGKRKILWNTVTVLALSSAAGAVLGSFVAGVIPTKYLRIVFGTVLSVSGVITLFVHKKSETT